MIPDFPEVRTKSAAQSTFGATAPPQELVGRSPGDRTGRPESSPPLVWEDKEAATEFINGDAIDDNMKGASSKVAACDHAETGQGTPPVFISALPGVKAATGGICCTVLDERPHFCFVENSQAACKVDVG
jgi:hypothetical protein